MSKTFKQLLNTDLIPEMSDIGSGGSRVWKLVNKSSGDTLESNAVNVVQMNSNVSLKLPVSNTDGTVTAFAVTVNITTKGSLSFLKNDGSAIGTYTYGPNFDNTGTSPIIDPIAAFSAYSDGSKVQFYFEEAAIGLYKISLRNLNIHQSTPPPPVDTVVVTFNSNGGSAVESKTITKGTAVSKPSPDQTYYGRIFAQWFSDTALTQEYNFSSLVNTNITLYAKWNVTVEFEVNGGTPAPATQTIKMGSQADEPDDPTKTGYEFAGWYESSTFAGSVFNFSSAVNTSTKLYAKWTAVTPSGFTVRFLDGDGVEFKKFENVASGTKVKTLTDTFTDVPTKTSTAEWSYTFSSWSKTGTEEITGDTDITSNFTQQKNKYYILFKNNGGTTLQNTQWEYGTIPSYSGTPTAEDRISGVTYWFNGWYPSITSVSGTKTYTATYTDNAVRVRYYNGSTLMATVPVASGTAWSNVARPSSTPTKSGDKEWKTYKFSGWTLSDGSTPPSTITSDTNVYAAFTGETKQQYQVSFYNGLKSGYGTSSHLSTVFVDYGTKLKDITKPTTTPTKESTAQYNFTFDNKWTNGVTNYGDQNVYDDNFEVKELTFFYAHYSTELRSYTIQFVNDQGSVLQSSNYNYGATPSYSGSTPVTETPHCKYVYAFKTWTQFGSEISQFSAVTGNATYTAKYYELDESDWTSITPSTLAVEDRLNAPIPYGFKGPLRMHVVDKGHVNVGGSTSGTVTLMNYEVLTKSTDGKAYYKRFDDSSNKWSTSELSDWLNNTLPGLFTQGKSGTALTNANKFLSLIKQPTLSTWVTGTESTERETLANWKFWIPSYTQMGGEEDTSIPVEDVRFDFWTLYVGTFPDGINTKRTYKYVGSSYGSGEYCHLRTAHPSDTAALCGIGWAGDLAFHGVACKVTYSESAIIFCLTMK